MPEARTPAESSCWISVRISQCVLSPSRTGTATVSGRTEPGFPTGAGTTKSVSTACAGTWMNTTRSSLPDQPTRTPAVTA